MKSKITAFIDGLITYDYILFGSSFLLFILLIILGIVLRRKTMLAVFLIFLSFTILFVGPTFGYVKIHEYLYKNTTEITEHKKLSFTQAVVVKGKITNESKRFFKSCKITASALKVSNNKLKNYIYSFKPFASMSIIEQNIAIGETREVKIIIEPFAYSKEFTLSIGAKCK
jgi:hypothetical protein